MKKIASIILLFLTFAVSANAELNEVRGILTKQEVKYVDNEKIFYFIFTNENSYPVWLDMELYYYSTFLSDNFLNGIVARKSITLSAGETYAWNPQIRTYNAGICNYIVKYMAYKKL